MSWQCYATFELKQHRLRPQQNRNTDVSLIILDSAIFHTVRDSARI